MTTVLSNSNTEEQGLGASSLKAVFAFLVSLVVGVPNAFANSNPAMDPWNPSGVGVCTGQWSYHLYKECDDPSHQPSEYKVGADAQICGTVNEANVLCGAKSYQACRHESHGIEQSQHTYSTEYKEFTTCPEGKCGDTQPYCQGALNAKMDQVQADFRRLAGTIPPGSALLPPTFKSTSTQGKSSLDTSKTKKVNCVFQAQVVMYNLKESNQCPYKELKTCEVPKTCPSEKFGVKARVARSSVCGIDPEPKISRQGVSALGLSKVKGFVADPSKLTCSTCEGVGDLELLELLVNGSREQKANIGKGNNSSYSSPTDNQNLEELDVIARVDQRLNCLATFLNAPENAQAAPPVKSTLGAALTLLLQIAEVEQLFYLTEDQKLSSESKATKAAVSQALGTLDSSP